MVEVHSDFPNGAQQENIRVRGSSIRFIQKGDGEPLVLLPSSGGQGKEYFEIIPFLSRSFRVVTFDYPGFGGSQEISTIREIKDLTGFTREFLETLQIHRPHILGFSMGGWIALHYALSFPKKVLNLVLLATTAKPFWDLKAPNPARLSFGDLLETFFFDRRAREKIRNRTLSRTEKKEFFRSNQAFNRLVRRKTGQPDLTPSLAQIHSPTLILGGENDRVISRNNLESLYRNIPESKLIWVRKTGHALIYEKPREIAGLILKFLK